MHISWITLLVFISISLLIVSIGMLVYDGFLRYRLAVRKRMDEFTLGDANSLKVSLFKDLKTLNTGNELHTWTLKKHLELMVEQAGVQSTVYTIILLSLGTGLVAAIVGTCHVWWLGILLTPLGIAIPFAVLYYRRNLRQQKLSRQLPEAFALTSRAVKSGQTVQAALRIIAEDFEPPISTEFALCYEEQNLGISRESSLRKLASRTGIMELQIFVVALLVQAQSGGNLTELLDILTAMIRKRLRLRERVKALTGEGQVQARILIVLPILVLVGLMVLAPEYSKELLNRPWLLAGTVAAQALGALWIRKIVNFQY